MRNKIYTLSILIVPNSFIKNLRSPRRDMEGKINYLVRAHEIASRAHDIASSAHESISCARDNFFSLHVPSRAT